jgi:hypothetical protein
LSDETFHSHALKCLTDARFLIGSIITRTSREPHLLLSRQYKPSRRPFFSSREVDLLVLLARSLWLPVISIRASVANPVAKENSAELLTTKGEPPTRSTFQLKIEIGLRGRKLSGVILSPLGLIVHPPRVLLSRHILEIDQLLEKLEIADQPAVVICPLVPCFISPSFSEICGSKFSKIFEREL